MVSIAVSAATPIAMVKTEIAVKAGDFSSDQQGEASSVQHLREVVRDI